jgi:hypothetical protein
MNGQGPFAHKTKQIRQILEAVKGHLKTGKSRPMKLNGAVLYASDHGKWSSFIEDLEKHVQKAVGALVLRKSRKLLKMTRLRDFYAGVWASRFEQLLESDTSINFSKLRLSAFTASRRSK